MFSVASILFRPVLRYCIAHFLLLNERINVPAATSSGCLSFTCLNKLLTIQMVIHANGRSFIIETDCVGSKSTPFNPLCICPYAIVKDMVALLSAWLKCNMGTWEEAPDTQFTSATSGETWMGFLCVVPLTQEMILQKTSATGLLLVCYFLSTLTLWLTSSSLMALSIFCQPLPYSSPVQPSLPSSRHCLLNVIERIMSKLNC